MADKIVVGVVSVVASVTTLLVNKFIIEPNYPNNPNDEAQKIIIEKNRWELKGLVEEARGVIDKGKGQNLEYLEKLLRKLIEAEEHGDFIDYVFQNKLKMDTVKNLDNSLKELKDLIHKQSENQNQSSGHENEDNIPLGNVRRCLLYLSCFPKDYVFNLKRITRLSGPHEFIPAALKLPDFQEVAESSWDRDGAPNHFLLKDNGRERIKEYPERVYLSRIAILKSIESNSYPSVILHVGTDHNLDFTERYFIYLRILSLRNVTLKKKINLNKLSSLQYLDLKHTHVRDCSWLEGLEKLQMLDLRYTYVEEIPEKCLKKLGELQHLLLGYIPKEGENQLAGTKLNPTMLKTTNLKTLRAVRRPELIEEISSLSNIVDLSVTGLNPIQLKPFWDVVENFENLTSLGVAVTKGSAITLHDCQDKLKNKLKRLRMEGQFSTISISAQPHAGLKILDEFKSLIDLTLASHKPINIDDIIPNLPKLLCLRLYGVCNDKIFKIGAQRFERLKKLVIGDMKNVEKIQIGCAVIETVDTLKLCNLPKLEELVCQADGNGSGRAGYVSNPDKQQSLLKWGKNTVEGCSKEDQSPKRAKTIFLRGFNVIPEGKSPCLTIYHYDMNIQCYKESKCNP